MLRIEETSSLFADLKLILTTEGLENLIKLHMGLGYGMAKKFAKHHNLLDWEDYVSVAYLGIVEAIHKAFEYMLDNNITLYVATYIRRRLFNYYRTDRAVSISYQHQDYLRRLGYMARFDVVPLTAEAVCSGHSEDLLDDLIEVLPVLRHRQVLFLILQDHTNNEISILLSMPLREVWRIRKSIKKLLSELLEEENGTA